MVNRDENKFDSEPDNSHNSETDGTTGSNFDEF